MEISKQRRLIKNGSSFYLSMPKRWLQKLGWSGLESLEVVLDEKKENIIIRKTSAKKIEKEVIRNAFPKIPQKMID